MSSLKQWGTTQLFYCEAKPTPGRRTPSEARPSWSALTRQRLSVAFEAWGTTQLFLCEVKATSGRRTPSQSRSSWSALTRQRLYIEFEAVGNDAAFLLRSEGYARLSHSQ